MKRLLVAIVLAIIIAVSITVITYRFGSGYVVLSFADTSIETSFIFALGFLAVAFFVFYYVIRAMAFIIRIPLYLRFRKRQRRAEQARQSLTKGMLALSEGRFADAEKILVKQAPRSDTTVLNYMMAARAAQLQNAFDRRDDYLKRARAASPKTEMAAAINQAELEIAHKEYDQALTTLDHVDKLSPKNDYVKLLLATTYRQFANWTRLSNLLDTLSKNKLLSTTAYNDLESDTYLGLLRQLSRQQNAHEILAIWQRLPRHLKDNGNILQIYAEQLITLKKDAEAEQLVRNHLNKFWHEPLLLTYAQINSEKPQQQLETVEAWLNSHRSSAVLLLVAGKLCLKNKLWGKARTYLEASLSIKPMAETYLNLAMLLEDKMQEPVKAQQHYQNGLKLAVSCGVTIDCVLVHT